MELVSQRYWEYAAWIFLLSLLGGIVPFLRRWSNRELQTLVSFSAGLLLGIIFLDLIPNAGDSKPSFFATMLLGFLLLLSLEKFVLIHPHEADELSGKRSGLAAYFGISLHSLLDGIALGSSAFIPHIGGVVLWAILAHKIPNSFSLSTILLFFGFGRRTVFLLLVLFSMLTPIGGALSLLLLRNASTEVLTLAIGLACGTFLFVATSDLLPHAHEHHEGRYRNLLAVLIGVSISYFVPLAHLS